MRPHQGLPYIFISPFHRTYFTLTLRCNYQVFLFLFVRCDTKYRFGTQIFQIAIFVS
jgi:hypothetical protein